MMDLTETQWVRYAVTHPVEGFDDMRWKKSGSLKIAFLIVGLLFFGEIADDRLFGAQFFISYERIFNVVPYIVQSIILFAVWVVGNWAVCTLLDGEGTMKNICIYSAYALIPYVAQLYINVILSHVLIRDESVFLDIIRIIGIGWTAVLLFSAIKSVHQYSFLKTAAAVLLTIAAMLIMLFLLVLMLALLQQIWIFISTVVTEIIYRIKV
ncbi:MAG: Yip1 family protein [Ruminococcus flavefaciens]|nr:Yip1 family protein [Ruminococcus flavefaciens]HQM00392.1 Yip1 family protein [Ruminococcus flavefaciens]